MTGRTLEARQAWEVVKFVWGMPTFPNTRHWQSVLDQSDWIVGKSELTGHTGAGDNEKLLSLVWAVRGDAFRELHHPREAADAYRTAFGFMPSAGFGSNYAQLVLENDIEDHYATALAALQATVDSWRKLPWYRKPLEFLILAIFKPIQFFRDVIPDLWRLRRWRMDLETRLREVQRSS